MTWRELWLRLWFFLRAHLRRQHMCPECGDALEDWLDVPMTPITWKCPSCEYKEEMWDGGTVTYVPPVKPGSPIHITGFEFYEIANGVMKEMHAEMMRAISEGG